MTSRRRLNEMTFCVCRHGQGAHRNGSGPCFGERRVHGTWRTCGCMAFVREPDDSAEIDFCDPVDGYIEVGGFHDLGRGDEPCGGSSDD